MGAIINISSVDGIRAGVWPNIPYAAAKGGVVTMTTHMAVHHGRDNVRVNCIAPGMIYTSQMIATLEAEQGMRQRRQFGAPLGTEGTAWDIAWAAVFLASDEARWITGVHHPGRCGAARQHPAVDAGSHEVGTTPGRLAFRLASRLARSDACESAFLDGVEAGLSSAREPFLYH